MLSKFIFSNENLDMVENFRIRNLDGVQFPVLNSYFIIFFIKHRSRSPLGLDYDMKDLSSGRDSYRMPSLSSSSSARRYNDFDDPRGGSTEDDIYRRRLLKVC